MGGYDNGALAAAYRPPIPMPFDKPTARSTPFNFRDPRWTGLKLIAAALLLAGAGVAILVSGQPGLGRKIILGGIGVGMVGMVVHLWIYLRAVFRSNR